MAEALLRALEAALPGVSSIDAADREAYGRDWTRVHRPDPCAVAFPKNTSEVAEVLRLARAHGVSVVPSGGRTGLAGGAVAARGELVLSLDRLRTLGPVDPVARTVRVGAGAVTAEVHQHCAPHGLTWPVDFASSGSSQVGGNIATNAGGVRVVRYGLTRQWVLGLEVVLATGEVLELNGALEKNNTGVDLRQLFIGSEGTLGVITAATLKLCPVPVATQVALLAVADLPTTLAVFGHARAEPGLSLLAFEYFTDACLGVVLEESGASSPFAERHPAYLLVEIEPGPAAQLEEVTERWLGRLLEEGLVFDGVLSGSASQAGQLWSYRERISESLSKKGFLHKNDVALPVSGLASFTGTLERVLAERYPDFGVYLFGHVGDGNLHVNIMKPEPMDRSAFLDRVHETDALLFSLLREHKGSVSAEHGIGLLKKAALPFSRSPAELALLQAVKRAFDPDGILNPGKIFD